jgi:penicillin-binding protein 1A
MTSTRPKRPSRPSQPTRSSPSSRPPRRAARGGSQSVNKVLELFRRYAKTRAGRWVLASLGVVAGLGVVGLLSLIGMFAYYSRDLPTIEALKHYRPPQISRVVDRHGRLIAESFTERRTVVPMSRVPRVLVLSVLAAEDADFYRHRGLDYAGIVRALLHDVMQGRRTQGASTITQQLVKTMLLTPERTIARKIRELILARRLEQELGKEEILGLYLNHINFGHGRYGVAEASRFYFSKPVEELDLSEASLIAGVPQNPARLSPFSHPEAARKRQLYVLAQLEHKRAQYWDDLPLEAITAARAAPAKLVAQESSPETAPEAATLARDVLQAEVGAEAVKLGGFSVESSIDLNLEIAARRALRAGLIRIDERQHLQAPLRSPKRETRVERIAALTIGHAYDALVRATDADKGELVLDIGGHAARASWKGLERWNPKQLPIDKFAERGAALRVIVERPDSGDEPARVRAVLGPQGAVVVIDARTREVLVLLGGDTAIYGFNRATQAVRQPGSTWKPIEFALAVDTRKFTPASLLLDAPEVYDEWKPNNYETWHYTGAVRLREALAQSINLVAIRVVAELTPRSVVDFAKRLGISTELDPSLALALGASGVRPLELVNAYATFAAGGKYTPARLVRSIKDADGHDLKLKTRAAPVEVLTAPGAYLITSMMTSVIQSGTGKGALVLKRPLAGKTGTSNKARDAWFIGYTPEIVAGVWVGYDDLRPLGKNESGANSALPIWIDVMKAILKDRPAVDFPMPSGLTLTKIDPKSGKLAYEGQPDAIDEVFLDGTVPSEVATPPDVVDTGTFMMEQLGDGRAQATN